MSAHDQPLTRHRLLFAGAAAATAILSGSGLVEAAVARAGAGALRRGGTLFFGMDTAASGFDPAKWWNGPGFISAFAVFDRLLRITDDGRLVPELLSAPPQVNAAGTQYTFRLRPGIKFHHGRVMTADDVKFSLERVVSPTVASEGASLYTGLTIPGMQDVLNQKAETLRGIRVVDRRTLTVSLEEPDTVFLYLLGLPFSSIVPRDVVEQLGDKQFGLKPVGTGPFRMTKADPTRHVTLERNAAFWDPPRPYADRVEWSIGVAANLSILRILAGEQDLMFEPIPAAQFTRLRGDPSLRNQVRVGPANNVNYITLSLKHPALRKLEVRRAIAMAIDKERLVRVVKGLGTPANGGLFSPLSPYYQPNLGYRYDPAKAKQLLAQAGFAKGFEVTFWGRNFTPYLEEGQTVQQDLAQIGIKVKLRQLNNDTILSIVVKNPPGITENEWELPYPHGSYVMDGAFTRAALKGGCCNFSSWVSPRFDKLAQAAHRTTNRSKIIELYKEMDRIAIRDEALWVPTFYPERADLISKRVRGYKIPVTPTPIVKRLADYAVA